MVYDLHYSIFVGLFYILIIAIEHLKWTNLWRHNEWEEFVWRSCSPSGCCCCYASILLSKVSREMNWRIGLLEPETQHMTVPNWGTEWWKKVGAGREKYGGWAWSPQKYCRFHSAYFRDEGMWMSDCVLPFASVLLGIPFAWTPLVIKAAIHIQFSFCVRIVHV